MYKTTLIIMSGLSGTGKSAIAEALSKKLKFKIIKSDIVRKKMARLTKTQRSKEGFEKGIYSKEFSIKTYDKLFDLAGKNLRSKKNTILDATFSTFESRLNAKTIAEKTNSSFFIIYCDCDEQEVKKRLTMREIENKDISDAGWEVYQKQKSNFNHLNKEEKKTTIFIDTKKDTDFNINFILNHLKL
ncbi:MAG: AAA family ATPase [Spirochaetia bacterium]|nr:AAA family ATPase [Spirochaetia bacterium]